MTLVAIELYRWLVEYDDVKGVHGVLVRHHITEADTGIPVGTTKQIQRYIQIFKLILYSESYNMSI